MCMFPLFCRGLHGQKLLGGGWWEKPNSWLKISCRPGMLGEDFALEKVLERKARWIFLGGKAVAFYIANGVLKSHGGLLLAMRWLGSGVSELTLSSKNDIIINSFWLSE